MGTGKEGEAELRGSSRWENPPFKSLCHAVITDACRSPIHTRVCTGGCTRAKGDVNAESGRRACVTVGPSAVTKVPPAPVARVGTGTTVRVRGKGVRGSSRNLPLNFVGTQNLLQRKPRLWDKYTHALFSIMSTDTSFLLFYRAGDMVTKRHLWPEESKVRTRVGRAPSAPVRSKARLG